MTLFRSILVLTFLFSFNVYSAELSYSPSQKSDTYRSTDKKIRQYINNSNVSRFRFTIQILAFILFVCVHLFSVRFWFIWWFVLSIYFQFCIHWVSLLFCFPEFYLAFGFRVSFCLVVVVQIRFHFDLHF